MTPEEQELIAGGGSIVTAPTATPTAPGTEADELAQGGGSLITPEALEANPGFDPFYAAARHKGSLEAKQTPADTAAIDTTGPVKPAVTAQDINAKLAQDPVYRAYQKAGELRVKRLADDPKYDWKKPLADRNTLQLAPSGTLEDAAKNSEASARAEAAADTAFQVAKYRTQNYGGPDKGPHFNWQRFGHGVKESGKDAFGLGGYARGAGYAGQDVDNIVKGAAEVMSSGEDADLQTMAKAELANRELQSGMLRAGMGLINTGYGLRNWWQGEHWFTPGKGAMAGMSDADLRARLEDEAYRKVTVPEKLKPENFQPFGGDTTPYNEVAEAAGGAPAAWADKLRIAQPADEEGKPIEVPPEEKRAADVGTMAEFTALGRILKTPGLEKGIRGVAAAAAYAPKLAAGAAGAVIGRTMGLVAPRLMRAYRALGHIAPEAAKATEGALKDSAWDGSLAQEIWQNKPLTAGSRAGRAAKEITKGALTGAAGAVPFALAADSPEDAASTVIGLSLFGGVHQTGEIATGKAWKTGAVNQLAKLGAETNYGTGYDAAHAEAMKSLTPRERDAINAMRGLLSRFKDAGGNPMELHAVSAETFKQMLAEQNPGMTPEELEEAARTRGYITADGRAFVNAGATGDKAQPGYHEGGHVINAALGAMDASIRESAKSAITSTLYDAQGKPVPEFQKFINGYNRLAPSTGQIDPNTPEGRVRGEDEFVAEHFRNIGNKPAHEGIGALVTGDTLYGRMKTAFQRWAKGLGVARPDKLEDFDWREVPAFTDRFNTVLKDALADAHNKPAPEPSAGAQTKRNATRMAEIEKLPPGARTPAIVQEYDKLRKANEELARQSAQIPAPGTPQGALAAPTSPAVAPQPPAAPVSAQARADVQKALIRLKFSARDAKRLAAAAQGTTDSELLRDAITKSRPQPAAAPTTSSSPVAPAPSGALAQKPAPPTPGGVSLPQLPPQVPISPADVAAFTQELATKTVAELRQMRDEHENNPTPYTEHATELINEAIKNKSTSLNLKSKQDAKPEGIVSNDPEGTAPKEGEPAPPPPAGSTPAEAAMDAELDNQIAVAAPAKPDRLPHILQLVSGAAQGDPGLLQQRTDQHGRVSYTGRINLGLPEHRALVRELGLDPGAVEKLNEAQNSDGAKYVDYWSDDKLDPTDITGAQRKIEHAAGKLKRSRSTLQKNKAIIFTGTTVWPTGSIVQKGISVDKFAGNIHKLIEAAKEHGLKVDYEHINDPRIQEDLAGYVRNHQNNIKGDGSGPVAGATPTEGYEPYLIPRNRFDLLNAAFNVDVSSKVKPALEQRAKYEQDLKEHEGALAARDAMPRGQKGKKPNPPRKPSIRDETLEKGQEAQALAEENGWQVDDATGDTNPFRAMLNSEGKLVKQGAGGALRKGTGENLEPVFESLAPDMIDAIRSEPKGERDIVRDVGFTGDAKGVLAAGLPNFKRVAGGFMPESKVPDMYGYHPDQADRRTPPHNWDEPDLYGGKWTPELIREQYHIKNKEAAIYPSLVELSDLDPKLAERESGEYEDGDGYDWSELQSSSSSPPPVVVTRDANGKIQLEDGNHRVHFWQERGYEFAPAWVIDKHIVEKAKEAGLKSITIDGKRMRFMPEVDQIVSNDPERKGALADGLPNFKRAAGGFMPAWDGMSIYRAGDKHERGIKAWSSWSKDKPTAEAYLDNPGFGGDTLRSEKSPIKNPIVADVRSRPGLRDLAEKLGFDSSKGDEWMDNGWQYPWEESKTVREALEKSPYDAIEYVDDFPQGAKTIVPIRSSGSFMPGGDRIVSDDPEKKGALANFGHAVKDDYIGKQKGALETTGETVSVKDAPDLAAMAKGLGLRYDGAQEFGEQKLHQFTDYNPGASKGATFYIKGEVTPEKVRAKQQEISKKFEGQYMPGGTVDKIRNGAREAWKKEYPDEPVENATAWWIDRHGNLIPVRAEHNEISEFTGGKDGLQDGFDAGMLRVSDDQRMGGDGKDIYYDAQSKTLTQAQRKALHNLAGERGGELIADTDKLSLFGGFMPSGDPRAIKEAAFRLDDGRIITGKAHHYIPHPRGYKGDFFDGFVTNSGEFLDREEAHKRAVEIGQINRRSYNKNAAEIGNPKDVLESIAFQQQAKFMPAAKGALADPIVSNDPSEKGGFYSALERVAADKIKGRATAEQITATLRNNGVKQEELDWVLGDFLRGKAGQKIEPGELRDAIAANKVDLTEHKKGDQATSVTRAKRDRYNELHDIGENQTPAEKDEYDALYREVSAHLSGRALNDTKFGQYQLPGGTNYREFNYVLPPTSPKAKASAIAFEKEHSAPHSGTEHIWGKQIEAQKQWAKDLFAKHPELEEQYAGLMRAAQKEERAGSQDYKVPPAHQYGDASDTNRIFHLRINDRTTTDGQTMLFGEELQGDWPQEARKLRDKEVDYIAKRDGITKEEASKLVAPGFGYGESKGKIPTGWKPEKREHDWVYLDRDNMIVGRGATPEAALQDSGTWGSKPKQSVPNQPFKGNSWKTLGIKKLLEKAVQEGKDSIGWTTGEQQAERYDLSKQIKSIEYHPDTQELYAYDHSGNAAISGEKVPPEKMADTIGKEAAEKLLSKEQEAPRYELDEYPNRGFIVRDKPENGAHGAKILSRDGDDVLFFKTELEANKWANKNLEREPLRIEGMDLKVGGEGMKGFYDRELVNIANDIARKAKSPQGVTRARIETRKRNTTSSPDIDENGNALNEAEVWQLPITPELRAAVQKGQSLFMPAANTPKPQTRPAAGKQGALAGGIPQDDRLQKRRGALQAEE